MPDPMTGSVPINSPAAKDLTDSRDLIKRLREEVREAERELNRLFQGISNKTLGGAGGWQVSFDPLHEAQKRLEEQKRHEDNKKPPAPPLPPSDSMLDRLAEMYKGRFDPLSAARTSFQALTGQWTIQGEAVAAGYNVLQMVSAASAPLALAGAGAVAAYSVLSRQTENRQLHNELQSERANAFLSRTLEDRINGRYGAEYNENMYRFQEIAFEREYKTQMKNRGYLSRGSSWLFGGDADAFKSAQSTAAQEAQRQAEIGRFGQRYADMTDIDKIEAENEDMLDRRGERRRRTKGFWSYLGWIAGKAVDIGNDPTQEARHEEAKIFAQERRTAFFQARADETFRKTQDEAKGLGYRTAMKDRNIHMQATEERLYKSSLQWNSF